MSVFEGVVYHCWCADPSSPCRPVLEVDARTQPGDLDAGPLLLTVADYMAMAGPDVAARCLPTLAEAGRIVVHQGVSHLAFPTWTSVTE
ncbi:MAG TPA: hypothetical protein VM938_07340 [Acidimicrobiales bacterium]|nr:hypothetical protein [Acidimicrobiales bacterium]